ncbi:MAG: DUF1329 domain-containing protein [Desulfobacteraceae bacterium]|nr:DUF1329 domain-containing protein [Desulfobacteraceae bacterium]
MNHRILMIISLMAMLNTGHLHAGVSATQALELGPSLTPVGAEKAGNPEGTIPAYTGGLPPETSPPGFHPESGRWTNPFPDEKPLYSVTGQNMAKYDNAISETCKALLKRDPTFRMDVYPSHRSAAYPEWVLKNTLKNATQAHLTKNGLALEGAFGGIPFPLPENGNEVMWNHMLVYNGYPAEYRGRNWYVDKNGKAVNTGALQASLQSGYYNPAWNSEELKKNGNAFFEAAYHFIFPPTAAGNAAYAIDTLDPVEQPRRAWSYSAATRRVRISPDLTHDTPIASQGGVTNYDEGYLFLGKLDLFDFKLIGKREMLIPYNNYRLVFETGSSQILTPKHLNPDVVRWELHRVWVVEATRKPDKRHSLNRRIFYFDEDWSGAGMSDAFGRGDQLVKGIFLAATPLYDAQMPLARCYWAYDLLSNIYTLIQHFGDPDMGYQLKPGGFPEMTFSPDALPNRGRE